MIFCCYCVGLYVKFLFQHPFASRYIQHSIFTLLSLNIVGRADLLQYLLKFEKWLHHPGMATRKLYQMYQKTQSDPSLELPSANREKGCFFCENLSSIKHRLEDDSGHCVASLHGGKGSEKGACWKQAEFRDWVR